MSELAINGGIPVTTRPLKPWPFYESDEIASVVSVLESGKVNYWTGDVTKKFESEFAQYHGMKHAIALSNGTLALELALIGLGIGAGDEVITTARTFIASASCIVRIGATPVLADIGPDSQNITVDTIKAVLTPKTKAIIAVHLAGWPCDMPAIMAFANEHGVKVIEDCAQAHGAKINGKLVGSFGHMAAFSFCQDKIMSTGGEGGILLTNNTKAYEQMWAFKDHGKSYDAVYRQSHPPGFRWLHDSFGTNWRFTEMQSAIGLLQLEKLASWVEKRRMLASAIREGISAIKSLRIPKESSDIYHSTYKFYVFVRPNLLKDGWGRDRIMNAIVAEGIPCFSGSCGEIYLEKAFTSNGLGPKERLPVAKELGETSLMFLVHPTLDFDYAADVVKAITKVFREATKYAD